MLLGHRVGTTKPFEPRQARDVAEPNRPRAQGQRRWEKGVIVGVATDISEDEIKADTGAVKVSRITKRNNEGRAVATTAVILFFDGPRPDSVYLGRRYTVREYIPRTLQCYRCRGFFHTASSCTKEVRCPSCGEGHGHDECPQRNSASVLHCANCGGNHSSAYRDCPSFKEGPTGRPCASCWRRSASGCRNGSRRWSGTRDSQEKLERKTAELELADLVVCPSLFVLDSLPASARKEKQSLVAEFGSPPRARTRRRGPRNRRNCACFLPDR